jgi:hypothetical protein
MQSAIEPEADRIAEPRADAIVLAVALLPIVLAPFCISVSGSPFARSSALGEQRKLLADDFR